MATKEKIVPPSPKDVKQAAKDLPKGGAPRGPDGRVMSEQKTSQ